jgi:BirA family biotin operon repressor/biotin-[acetyl-CoA-carboxylase] ligase
MTSDKYDIIYFPETDSTNLQASALLSERDDNRPFVVLASYQQSGRGQSENTWTSERGQNLLCSVVVFPDHLDISNHFYLSKVMALVLHDTLKHYVSFPLIKWPNDILVNERKIAGILIENSLLDQKVVSSVIGIGLNVNQQEFPQFKPQATSIFSESGVSSVVDDVLDHLLDQFDYWYDVLAEKRWQLIDSYYLRALYRFNQFAPYRNSDHEFRARIAGVEPDGHLLLETDQKDLLRFSFKEVEFILQ